MKKRNKRDTFLFKIIKLLARPINHKAKFHFVEELKEPTIIISNHNFPRGPTKWSYYFPSDHFYIWANSEFCFTVKRARWVIRYTMERNGSKCKLWRYIAAFFVAPFLVLGFKHSRVIPTYKDMRFYLTVKESVERYKEGNHIILFVDDATEVYTYEVKDVQPGFLIFAKALKEEGYDPYISASQGDRKRKNIVIDKPIRLSELLERFKTDQEILDFYKEQINNMVETHQELINKKRGK